MYFTEIFPMSSLFNFPFCCCRKFCPRKNVRLRLTQNCALVFTSCNQSVQALLRHWLVSVLISYFILCVESGINNFDSRIGQSIINKNLWDEMGNYFFSRLSYFFKIIFCCCFLKSFKSNLWTTHYFTAL